ncbi:hypothetical protein TNCV_2729801 [Trichonephila clavipes]|nr:hypothetical protein TNCV_2729801 [Trichonephila clavipes]
MSFINSELNKRAAALYTNGSSAVLSGSPERTAPFWWSTKVSHLMLRISSYIDFERLQGKIERYALLD